MSRLIDADVLKTIKSIQSADFNSIETIRQWIDSAPTIKTKQIKYYDEGEQVWKIGEVIVSDSEKPNNSKEREGE